MTQIVEIYTFRVKLVQQDRYRLEQGRWQPLIVKPCPAPALAGLTILSIDPLRALSADEQRDVSTTANMERFVGECDLNRRRHLDTRFFTQFPQRALGNRFIRFDMTTRKLPAMTAIVHHSFTEQKLSVSPQQDTDSDVWLVGRWMRCHGSSDIGTGNSRRRIRDRLLLVDRDVGRKFDTVLAVTLGMVHGDIGGRYHHIQGITGQTAGDAE